MARSSCQRIATFSSLPAEGTYFHADLFLPRLADDRSDPRRSSRGHVLGIRQARSSEQGAGAAARLYPRQQHGRAAHLPGIRILRHAAERRYARAGHPCSDGRLADRADVPRLACGTDSRARLAERRGDHRRGPRRRSLPHDRRTLGPRVARPAQSPHLAGRPRFGALHRAGRAARSDGHGQLQQERIRRYGRRARDQRKPFHRRRLRHGADDGPGRYAAPPHLELRPGTFLRTCRWSSCSR